MRIIVILIFLCVLLSSTTIANNKKVYTCISECRKQYTECLDECDRKVWYSDICKHKFMGCKNECWTEYGF